MQAEVHQQRAVVVLVIPGDRLVPTSRKTLIKLRKEGWVPAILNELHLLSVGVESREILKYQVREVRLHGKRMHIKTCVAYFVETVIDDLLSSQSQ